MRNNSVGDSLQFRYVSLVPLSGAGRGSMNRLGLQGEWVYDAVAAAG